MRSLVRSDGPLNWLYVCKEHESGRVEREAIKVPLHTDKTCSAVLGTPPCKFPDNHLRRDNVIACAGNRRYRQKLSGLARGRRDSCYTALECRHAALEYILKKGKASQSPPVGRQGTHDGGIANAGISVRNLSVEQVSQERHLGKIMAFDAPQSENIRGVLREW